jgi:uncharacterized protein YndB with AHSA1/START domain
MTTPNVPRRIELRFEVPGTPEQVWQAVATSDGITAWFLPTDVDEREGGAIVTHMGPGEESPGTVTGFDPPRRFAYEEPDWAALAGHAEADVTPLASEFLVEAQSGGTCVVRVVSSAFGTGADWEQEFFDDMARYWAPMFDHLRLYLTRFSGQRATTFEAGADVPGATATDVVARMCEALGAAEAGQPISLPGLAGEVEKIDDVELLARLTDPNQGYLAVYAFDKGNGDAYAGVRGWLFGNGAAAVAERGETAWKSWFEHLASPVR